MLELTAENVVNTMKHCLFEDSEIVNGKPIVDPVMVQGIVRQYGFHPGRLEEKREEVKAMLSQLPHQFRKAQGGGWSFLQACVREDGVQWGEHPQMDDLLCLGIGLKLAGFCLEDRQMWAVMPGGVPYVWIEA